MALSSKASIAMPIDNLLNHGVDRIPEAKSRQRTPRFSPARHIAGRGSCPTFIPMADNLENRGSADRTRINIHEAHELRYWTKALGVTEEQLKSAVAKVGVMAADVRRHLGK